jgi:ribosomal-protein-alanine N-acetyltransferase
LRHASLADIPALAELERDLFTDPWTTQQLEDALRWPGAVALIAEDAEGIFGYVLGRVVVDQAEILSIATATNRRRQGIGSELLDAALIAMLERGARSVWLEVRVSNAAARAMYGARGFVAAGVRRGYYRQPPEDALVLRRDLVAARAGKS